MNVYRITDGGEEGLYVAATVIQAVAQWQAIYEESIEPEQIVLLGEVVEPLEGA